MASLASPSVRTPASFWSPRRRRLYGAFGLAVLLFGAERAIADWRDCHAFLINATQSLPNWAFLIERGARPTRGAYVFFDPPHDPLVIRHFGARPAMFGKIVYGVGGDVVTRVDRTFYVDGRKVAVAKTISHFGEPLALGPVGRIPVGCYFVGSPHSHGIHVMAISTDGGPSSTFHNYVVDSGQRERMGLHDNVTPAVILFDTATQRALPIGYGVMAADELMDRIFALTATQPGKDY